MRPAAVKTSERARGALRVLEGAAIWVVCTAAVSRGQGSLMLVGGGAESYGGWSDAPYAWFVQRADSGIIINIDVGSVSSWYPAYFISLGADPASHGLQIATVAQANSQAVYNDLVSARGVFIEGGDQWAFVATWKGTLVEEAIHHVFNSGGVIGGTSAGCAILGEVVYDAHYGSVYPEEAAYDPYDSHISFTDDFLSILPGVLTDSHFHARGRMGRLVPFLARRIQDHGDSSLAGIGVEEKTAFCIGPDRVGTVYGEEVAIVFRSPYSVVDCQPGVPPTFTAVRFDQLLHGARYDLAARRLVGAGTYLTAVQGPGPDPAYSAVTLNGSSEQTAQLGEVQVTGVTSSPNAWWYGTLGIVPGQGVVPRSVIMPRLWSNHNYFANRWVGALLGVALNPHFSAWYLDDGCLTSITESGLALVGTLTYVVTTRSVTHVGTNAYNIPGMVGAFVHFLGPGDTLDLLPPSPVSDLSVSIEPSGSPLLTWSVPNDNVGVRGYAVHRATDPYFATAETTLAGTTTSPPWDDPTPLPLEGVFYRVVAVDRTGNESLASSAAGVLSFVVDTGRPKVHPMRGCP